MNNYKLEGHIYIVENEHMTIKFIDEVISGDNKGDVMEEFVSDTLQEFEEGTKIYLDDLTIEMVDK